MNSPRIRAALRQAARNLEFNKRSAAIQIYRDVLAEDDQVAAAWAGLGDALPDEQEREQMYERALAIDPTLESAATSLARLRGELPPEPEPEPEPEPRAAPPTIAQTSTPEWETVPPAENRPRIPELQPLAELDEADEESYEAVCYRHPQRTTSLRCYSCGRPICISCANKTPVGYSCTECLREKEKDFYTATALDYLIAFFITMPLSVIGVAIASSLGWFIIFVAPLVGSLIGRVVFWAVRRRRGRRLPQLVVGTIILGALIYRVIPGLVLFLMAVAMSPGQVEGIGQFLTGGLFNLLFTGIYIALASSAAYYQMRV